MLTNRLLRNFKVLMTGTALTAVLSIVNVSVLVQAVGLENNGKIFLALAYSGLFSALFNFQSNNGLIKYLPKVKGDKSDLGKYISQALALDLSTAVFAFILSFSMIDIIARMLDWSPDVIEVVKLIAFSTLFKITGVFDGVFRFYEKFNYLNIKNIITVLFTFLCYSTGLLFELDFKFFVIVTLITPFITLVVCSLFLFEILNKDGISLSLKNYDRKFFRFSIITSLSSSLDIPIIQLTPLVIGNHIGLTELAVYKILEKISSCIGIITSVLSQVVSPELSDLISKDKYEDAQSMAIKSGCLVFAVGLSCFIIGAITHTWWLGLLISDYTSYYVVISAFFIYSIINYSFFSQHYLFIFSGYEKHSLYILLCVNFVYTLLLLPVTSYFGLLGLITLRATQAIAIFYWRGRILHRHSRARSWKILVE